MEKNYKALGGLFEVKFATGDDAERLSAEDFEFWEDEKETEKETEKIEEKPKNAKDILNDSDIPYEVRMKYIIEAYRKDQEKWGKLVEYAKHLESDVIRLKEIQIANGFTDKIEGIEIQTSAQLIKDLRHKVNDLQHRVKELKKSIGDPTGRIRYLESKIEKTYPERKFKISSLKKVIKNQELYIEELQKLLDENGIAYNPKKPINNIEAMGADNIDENAVRD